MQSLRSSLVTVLCLLSAACGEVDGADSEGDTGSSSYCESVPVVTWNNWGDGFFRTWCRGCHSSTAPDRHGAPTGLDFDSEESVILYRSSIRSAVLESGTMPLGGGLDADSTELLTIYLDCTLGD